MKHVLSFVYKFLFRELIFEESKKVGFFFERGKIRKGKYKRTCCHEKQSKFGEEGRLLPVI